MDTKVMSIDVLFLENEAWRRDGMDGVAVAGV